MPWAMPPWSWPSTIIGLMGRPQSWTATQIGRALPRRAACSLRQLA
jgi:hypothetical protein